MPTSDQLAQIVVTVLASGGGGAVVAYAIFKTLGKSWIDSRFQKELEQFKHERAKELARHQVELEALKAGSLKLLEREFEILPSVNAKLNEAWGVANYFASPMQEFQAVGRMAPSELEEFLENSKFTESQRESIRHAKSGSGRHSRDDVYQGIEFWYRLHKTKLAVSDLQSYVASNSVFIVADLQSQIAAFITHLWRAVVAMESAHQAQLWEMKSDAWRNLDGAKGEYAALQTAIKDRIHSHGKVA